MKAKQMRAGGVDPVTSGSGGERSAVATSVRGGASSSGSAGAGEPEPPRERLDPVVLDAISEVLSDAILAVDTDGRVVFANAAAVTAWGMPSVSEMMATPLDSLMARLDLFDGDGRRVTAAELPGAQLLSGDLSGRVAQRLIRVRRAGATAANGDRWMQIQARPALGPRGELRHVVNILRDVTEQETAARRDRFLGEASAILSAAVDVPGALQAMAEHVVRSLAGLCAIDLCEPGGVVRRVATAHRDPLKPQVSPRIADPQPGHASDGSPGPEVALGAAGVLRVPLVVRGDTVGVVTLANDDDGAAFSADDVAVAGELARRASISIDNARLYAQTQDVVRSREDLLAIVSHDLRNPLGVVLTSSALLLRAALPPDKGDRARRQVEAIQRAGNRMNRLIRDLLDLGSIQGGQLVLTRRTHDAGSLMTEAVEALQPQAVQKSQRLVAERPAEALMISCDRERVVQVLGNVVGNAIKFSSEGGAINVSVTADGGDAVRFTVRDDGPGMAPEELQHMYDRYWQARRKNREGIGLGLSLVKGIVEGHGGRVWAESEVGLGTTVHFTLPTAPSAAPLD